MLIRIWQVYVAISCAFIQCLVAKTFSLNEAIAAEESQNSLLTTSTLLPETPKRFHLNKALKSKTKTFKATETPERFSLNKPVKFKSKSKKFKTSENKLSHLKKISPLQYRKKFQIKSPLKPRKVKYLSNRRKRKNASKREVIKDEIFNRKYVPLLKSLSMLFDNILATDSSESHETRRGKSGRRHKERNDTGCTCGNKTNANSEESKPTEKAAISTTAVYEITTDASTEAPTTTTYNPPISNFSSFGQHTNIPVLPARNTSSTGRDHTGLGEGSSATFHTSSEGDIAGDRRYSERYTRSREEHASTKDDEENTIGATRDDASSIEYGRGIRRDGVDTGRPVYRRGFDGTDPSAESEGSLRGNVEENYLEVGRDETESPKSVQQFIRGDRRFISEEKVDHDEKHVQPKEGKEEGVFSGYDIPSNQRVAFRGSQPSTEDQKIRSTNAGVISRNDLINPTNMLQQNSPQLTAPFVTIFDGYSVARDKNGANKLTEQSIRFHS